MMSVPDAASEAGARPLRRTAGAATLRCATLYAEYLALHATLAADLGEGPGGGRATRLRPPLDALAAIRARARCNRRRGRAGAAVAAGRRLARRPRCWDEVLDTLARTCELDPCGVRSALRSAGSGGRAAFGLPGADVHLMECPMALGDGARWLQDTEELRNPYFGEQHAAASVARDHRRGARGSPRAMTSEPGDRFPLGPSPASSASAWSRSWSSRSALLALCLAGRRVRAVRLAHREPAARSRRRRRDPRPGREPADRLHASGPVVRRRTSRTRSPTR